MLIFYIEHEGGGWKPFHTDLTISRIRRLLRSVELDEVISVSPSPWHLPRFHAIILSGDRRWDTVNGWWRKGERDKGAYNRLLKG